MIPPTIDKIENISLTIPLNRLMVILIRITIRKKISMGFILRLFFRILDFRFSILDFFNPQSKIQNHSAVTS